jgi:hypothetical protein
MHVHVQRLVSVVKMATVHEACTIKEQCSVVQFLWAKGLNAMDNHISLIFVQNWCQFLFLSFPTSRLPQEALFSCNFQAVCLFRMFIQHNLIVRITTAAPDTF